VLHLQLLTARPCLGLTGGPAFPHTEAYSLQVATADQAETDRYWHARGGSGRRESAAMMTMRKMDVAAIEAARRG
jgi:2-polyprenyl-6-hydroxyphenyl methylase/3-demethylubiquinone-9 3-methyltransferase